MMNIFIVVVHFYFKRCAKLKNVFFVEFQQTENFRTDFSAGINDNISIDIKICQDILTLFHLK